MALVGRVSALGAAPPRPACLPRGLQQGTSGAGVRGLMARGVPRCERYGVVPLARMVQQNQYHHSLPAQETGSPAAQPPGKGRKSSRVGRKRLRQGLGQKPGLLQAQRPATAQQPWGPGALSPASARDKAEPTTRHPAAQWRLEPSAPPAVTVLEQDFAGRKRLPGGAQHGAGGSARPACMARTQDGSIRSSLAAGCCGATLVPAVEERRRPGESVLGAERALRRAERAPGVPRPQPGAAACQQSPSPPRCPQACPGRAGATSTWISASTRSPLMK